MSDGIDVPPTQTLAALYEKQGLFSQAEEVYRRLLETDPDNGTIREALEALEKRHAKKKSRPADHKNQMLSEFKRWHHAIRLRKKAPSMPGGEGPRILVVLGPESKGPNKKSLAQEVEERIGQEVQGRGGRIEIVQTVDEADFVRAMSAARLRCDALVVNPKGVEPTAINDDLLADTAFPVFEVFLGHGSGQSPVSHLVSGHMSGIGVDGFVLAIRAAVALASEGRVSAQEKR